jgi:hypothetical protein
MKRILSIFLLLAAMGSVAPMADAQTATTPFTAPWYFATSFGLWSINQQSPNTYIYQGRSLCNSQGQNVTFFDFATNAPVLIADSNTANSEVVTPTSIVNTAGSCGVAIAPTHNHFTYQLRSGTAGLQEALNVLKGQAIPSLILLDRNWWAQANNIPGTNGATILAAAVGDMTTLVEDITTAPVTFYVWSGTAFTSTNALSKNTAPTIAAGAGAGSAPTVSNTGSSTAIAGTASVLTGTATTTGTLFTETWPAVSAGGPQYAGTCVVTSSGANAYTTFTSAMSSSGSTTTFQRILTVTVATTAPVASTQYFFTYNCK